MTRPHLCSMGLRHVRFKLLTARFNWLVLAYIISLHDDGEVSLLLVMDLVLDANLLFTPK